MDGEAIGGLAITRSLLLNEPALLLEHALEASVVIVDELGEIGADQYAAGLCGASDVLLPLRRLGHLLHQLLVEGDGVGRHLAGQRRDARLLELLDADALRLAGRNVGP